MKSLTAEVPYEMSLAACPTSESPAKQRATGTVEPGPRTMLLLASALSRPLVVVDPDAAVPLLKLSLSRMPPDEDVSVHAGRLSRAQSRVLERMLGMEPPDASGPRTAPGRPNPFGNRHQRRAHNAKARRTP